MASARATPKSKRWLLEKGKPEKIKQCLPPPLEKQKKTYAVRLDHTRTEKRILWLYWVNSEFT